MKDEQQKEYARTGCLLLDMLMGGNKGVFGVPFGCILGIVGDSSSGKTALAHELTAANYHRFKKDGVNFTYNYDPVESGSQFSTEDIWNFPQNSEYCSTTVEDLDANLTLFNRELKKNGGYGLYIVDSIDGLTSQDSLERGDERAKNMEKEGSASNKTGSRNIDVPAFLSKNLFRNQTKAIEESNNLFVTISQLRENMDAGLYGPKQRMSGGKALQFYQSILVWLTSVKKIKKTLNGKEYVVGSIVRADLKKSRSPRPFRSVTYIVYWDTGISDVESSLVYLYDLLDARYDLKAAADNIPWEVGEQPCTDSSYADFIRDHNLTKQCKDDRKRIEDKVCGQTIPVTWAKAWINQHAPDDVRKEFVKTYGRCFPLDELCRMIEDDPDMKKELDRRVIAKYEQTEDALLSGHKKKYED